MSRLNLGNSSLCRSITDQVTRYKRTAYHLRCNGAASRYWLDCRISGLTHLKRKGHDILTAELLIYDLVLSAFSSLFIPEVQCGIVLQSYS
jgi:hypothetical protein